MPTDDFDQSLPVCRSLIPGGLRIVTEQVPGVHSAAVGIWVDVGSRDEDPHVAGAAHFLEHLLFKATPTRSATDIAQAVDAVGGEFNAFTGKEHTCYYAHMLDSDLELAIDLVSDVVLNGLCRAADMHLERDVILEEIAMRDDDPEDALGDIFLSTLLGNHPLGRAVIGTVDSVGAMTPGQLQHFHASRYIPEKMVVAVAGNITHDQVVDYVQRRFAPIIDPHAHPTPIRSSQADLPTKSRCSLIHRDIEQVHMCWGVPVYGRHWPSRYALSVLNTILGGGLSSRLFQQIRETRGLAYSVYSSVETFSDLGALSIYTACSPSHFDHVIAIITEIIDDLVTHGVTEQECRIAKGSLRGGLVLGLEDPSARMNRLGRNELYYGEQRDLATTLAHLNAVSVEEVNTVAAQILTGAHGLAILGPYHNHDDLPQLAGKFASES